MSIGKRTFFDLCFKAEGRIGRGIELEHYDLAGYSPETIQEAARKGKPLPGFDHQILAEGRKIGQLPPGIKLTVARRAIDSLDFDVVVNPLSWRIVSNRLGAALKGVAAKDVEMLPVVIRGLSGEILREDFCVINVLRMIEGAISERKTVRSRDKESILKLAIIGNQVPEDVHVFRVKEWPWAFVIDDAAERALCSQPHDGLAFIPVEME